MLAMLKFERTWSFLRANDVSSKGYSNGIRDLLLRGFVFENADGNCERFRYGSKEVADDGGILDRFFSSG